ncbi:GNAT family N-acetyltransferase [Saliphagus infecundisoli]|uniref:GNAT family N-acetyltransferase n=1 Tax=Saliphagus infecundisoli TaxID=1849069 RepID=A0ABD5QHC3_9EURY|nr:GNAT family N-acetyltransferase [Saliphagus infecundisoli]
MSVSDVRIRRATHDDYDAVVAMVEDVWADRGGDYLPEIYHDWLEEEGAEDTKTFVAEVGDDVAGIVQAVLVGPEEAWFQTMRVDADYRRQGISGRLNRASFDWARDRGATVGRVMIFSWNVASLAAARSSGFEPITEFRWAHPEPDPDAAIPEGYDVLEKPAAAWRYWTDSPAREHLRGLGLAPEESWALRELTREDLTELPALAVADGDGLRGSAYRSRVDERTGDDGEVRTRAEYAGAAWADLEGARALFGAIARDAAAVGASEVRVCLPETAETVSDAASVAGAVSEEPDFVLGIDLTR